MGSRGYVLKNEDEGITVDNVEINSDSKALFVNPLAGNNSNDGLSTGTAKATIQGALDAIPKIVEGVYTINLADGTYNNTKVVIPAMLAKVGDATFGANVIKIQGNDITPANVIWNAGGTVSGDDCITHRNNPGIAIVVSGIRFTNANRILTCDNAVAFFNITTADNIVGAMFQVQNSAVLTFMSGGSTTVVGTNAAAGRVMTLSVASRVVQNHNLSATATGLLAIAVGSGCIYQVASTSTLSLTRGVAPSDEFSSFGIRVQGQFIPSVSGTTIDTYGTGIQLRQAGQVQMTASSIVNINNCTTGWRFEAASYLDEGNTCTYNYTAVTTPAKAEQGAVIKSFNTLNTTITSIAPDSATRYGYDFRYGQLAASNTFNAAITVQPSITLSGGSTTHFMQWGAGTTSAVSAASTGRIRYSESTQKLQISENGGAYADIGVSVASGWTDDGATVRLTTVTDSVGIGTSVVNASAILDVTSITKGFLSPRMVTADRNAIAAPIAGLEIFNTLTAKKEFYNGTSWNYIGGGEFAQTNVSGIVQVINSSTPTKITGVSTFLEDGGNFNNNGINNLTIKYIGASTKFIEFSWHCVVREDPAGAGTDGTVNVHLAVGGVIIAETKSTTPVDAIHGGTASGNFIRSCIQNEVFELFANRDTGGGNGAVTNVVFSAKIL